MLKYLNVVTSHRNRSNQVLTGFFEKSTCNGESRVMGGVIKMYAVIETGGKQFRVQQGDVIYVEKLDANVGDVVTIDQVLLVEKDGSVSVGTPVVAGATAVLKVVEHGKGEKIIVFKYKAKKNYRRKQGHRQPYTKVVVEALQA